MRVTLRRGSSFALRWRGQSWRLRQGETRQIGDVAQYLYLAKVHSSRLEFASPVSCVTMVRDRQRRHAQQWEASSLQKQGWRAVEAAEALSKASSVLVVRNMGLGDVLMTTPLLRELKLRTGAQVCFATLGRYVPVLWRNPWVDSVAALGTDYLPERFDVAIDLNWWPELSKDAARLPRQEILAKAAGVTLTDMRPVYRIAPEEARWARGLLEEMHRPLAGVQVRASSALRSYPRVKLVRTVELLVRAGFGVVILDETPGGAWPAGALDLSGALSIREAGAVIGEADVLIAPDSGLMHLAAAVGTPCVALFGPIAPERRVKGYEKCTPLQGNDRIGCAACHDEPRCRGAGPAPCLSAISPREIVAAARRAANDRLTPGPSPSQRRLGRGENGCNDRNVGRLEACPTACGGTRSSESNDKREERRQANGNGGSHRRHPARLLPPSPRLPPSLKLRRTRRGPSRRTSRGARSSDVQR